MEDVMSHSQSNEIKRPENLVRLKIDGAKTSVNTLREQETARGVSLVCPFPSLEVDIPVQFGNTANLNLGSIHRIGVEDDPTTGLPRLRLSIRTQEPRSTVIVKTSESLINAVKQESLDLRAETGEVSLPATVAQASPLMVKPAGSWAEFISEISTPSTDNEENTFDEFSMSAPSDNTVPDPTWAMAGEMPLPEDIRDRVITRRRYKMVRHVAGAFILGMLAASLYLFDRAGVISFSNMKDKIASIIFNKDRIGDTAPAVLSSTPTALAAKVEVTPDQVAEVDPKAATEVASASVASSPIVDPAIVTASYGEGPNPLMAAVPSEPIPEIQPPTEPETAETVASAPATENASESKTPSDGNVTLNLPTRWPAEYATAYRVREPNGVVVDVPGGLVKREGWLEQGKENPMIRSIKSIQRESGARFIVYVNGELPRFITTPTKTGIALRLYFNADDAGTSAVAALDK
jgi:hypothetical protein